MFENEERNCAKQQVTMIFALYSLFAAKFFPIFLNKNLFAWVKWTVYWLRISISINVCITKDKRAVRIETTVKI